MKVLHLRAPIQAGDMTCRRRAATAWFRGKPKPLGLGDGAWQSSNDFICGEEARSLDHIVDVKPFGEMIPKSLLLFGTVSMTWTGFHIGEMAS